MKKFTAVALAGLGSMTVAAAAPSMAASTPTAPTGQHAAPVVGNLQHTPMQYWCNKGVPSYIIAVRAVKAPEKSVTFVQVELKETHTLGPVTHDKPLTIFSKINLAGQHVTLKVTGNTSGSSFTVHGTVPTTCAGLPNGSVTPAPGQTKPALATTPASPMPHKPAGTPAPAKPIGPQVQTDLVTSSHSNTTGELALAGLALAGLGAGSVVAAPPQLTLSPEQRRVGAHDFVWASHPPCAYPPCRNIRLSHR